jgi:hypothetical protein
VYDGRLTSNRLALPISGALMYTMPRGKKFLLILTTATLAACNLQLVTTPPPEAILLGTWRLIPIPDSSITQQYLVFNEVGRLIELRTKTGNITVTETNIHQLTRVTGNAVRIETTKNTVFEGILNDEKNIITGNVSTVIMLGGTTITTDDGPATLNKQ